MGNYSRFRLDSKSVAIGAGGFFLLCVLPWVSAPVSKVIASVRDMIGGNK